MYLHYPIALRLKGKECLVVGGGQVAFRKVISLLQSGAMVKVVSPKLIEEIETLVYDKKIIYEQREFIEADLNRVFLVIGATDQRLVNSRIGQLAQEQNILVNIVDQPEDCNFIVPAIHRAGGLSIAVTTDGKSPALAGKIRRALAEEYSDVYDIILEWLGDIRVFLLCHQADSIKRRKILIDLASFELVKYLQAGQVKQALEMIKDYLSDMPEYELLLEKLTDKYIDWLGKRDISDEN